MARRCASPARAGEHPLTVDAVPRPATPAGPGRAAWGSDALTTAATLCGPGPAELDDLAGRDPRGSWSSSVAATGGHLGSNLGVVELTLALHRVFDSPADPILWDTGHQAYVHKLVTGRAGDFAGLRQAGGLSGYPNRTESAPRPGREQPRLDRPLLRLRPRPGAGGCGASRATVVAVVGDGALTGGLAYEALNNIGVAGDAGRSSCSTTTAAPTRPTVSPLTTAGRLDARAVRPQGAGRRSSRRSASPTTGPVDGHDLAELERRLPRRPSNAGPVVAARPHGEGPRLPLRRGRRGQVPARHRPLRPRHRRRLRPRRGRSYTEAFAAGRRGRGRGRPRAGRDHRGHGRPDRADRLRRAATPTASSTSASPSSTP